MIYNLADKAASTIGRHLSFGTRLLLGGAAGTALLGLYGPRQLSLEDRLAAGVTLGAGAGVAAPLLVRGAGLAVTGVGGLGRFSLRRAGRYFAGMPGHFNRLRQEGTGFGTAAYKAFGRFGSFAAAGGLLGLYLGGREHPLAGAAIGAAAGVTLRAGIGLVRGYRALGAIPGGRTAAVLTTSALVFAGARAYAGPPEAAGVVEARLGPGAVPVYSDLRGRMEEIGAEGDIVLGLHNRRHG